MRPSRGFHEKTAVAEAFRRISLTVM